MSSVPKFYQLDQELGLPFAKVIDAKYYKEKKEGLGLRNISFRQRSACLYCFGGVVWPCIPQGLVAQENHFFFQSISLLFIVLGMFNFALN